jgi:hypothetical protein
MRSRIFGSLVVVGVVLGAPLAEAAGIGHRGGIGGSTGGGINPIVLGESDTTSNGYWVERDNHGSIKHVLGGTDANGKHDLYIARVYHRMPARLQDGWKRGYAVDTLTYARNGVAVASIASAVSTNDHISVLRFSTATGVDDPITCAIDTSNPSQPVTTVTQWMGPKALYSSRTVGPSNVGQSTCLKWAGDKIAGYASDMNPFHGFMTAGMHTPIWPSGVYIVPPNSNFDGKSVAKETITVIVGTTAVAIGLVAAIGSAPVTVPVALAGAAAFFVVGMTGVGADVLMDGPAYQETPNPYQQPSQDGGTTNGDNTDQGPVETPTTEPGPWAPDPDGNDPGDNDPKCQPDKHSPNELWGGSASAMCE